jgi:hypothetical protein
VRRIALAGVLLLGLVGCGHDKSGDNGTAASTTTTAPFGTADVSMPTNTPQGILTRVQVGAHSGFTRVVFEFSNTVPGYSIKQAHPPFVQDGSGKTVGVTGDGHLVARLVARAHDDTGTSSVARVVTGPKNSAVTQVVMTGDFEGVVNFVIGTKSQPPSFRLAALASPPRLVIDVATS